MESEPSRVIRGTCWKSSLVVSRLSPFSSPELYKKLAFSPHLGDAPRDGTSLLDRFLQRKQNHASNASSITRPTLPQAQPTLAETDVSREVDFSVDAASAEASADLVATSLIPFVGLAIINDSDGVDVEVWAVPSLVVVTDASEEVVVLTWRAVYLVVSSVHVRATVAFDRVKLPAITFPEGRIHPDDSVKKLESAAVHVV